jgi:hypothetical protein
MAEAALPEKGNETATAAESSSTQASSSSSSSSSSSGPPPPGPRKAVRELNRLLDEARAQLRVVYAVDAAVAAVAGVVGAVVVAAVVIGVAPFSLGLRDALLAFIAVAAVGSAGAVLARRFWPLRHDLVVAGALEAALRRRGLGVNDLVRSAVELRDSSQAVRAGRAQASFSQVLADAHVVRAVDVVRTGAADHSLRAVGLERGLPSYLALALVMAVLGGWWIASPQGLSARLQKLFDGAAVEAALAERALQQAPIVTDLTITLRYPAHMKLRDDVIAGASGDISAPRGTEVVIAGRADRDVKGAALVVSGGKGEEAIAATVSGTRDVSARFVVDAAGAWRFRLTPRARGMQAFGGDILDPVARKITLRDDAVPAVVLKEPAKDAVVQADDDVDVDWSASDDFGVGEVKVVVKRQGLARAPFEKILRDGKDGAERQVKGKGAFSIADTGARAGEKLSVTVEAIDNDAVSGPKVGRSATRVLTVFSAQQHHREVIQRLEELLGQMVEVLGDELEAPLAGVVDGVAQKRLLERHRAMGPRSEVMLKLFDDTLAAVSEDDLFDDDEGVRRALANMRLDLSRAALDKENAVARTPPQVLDRPVATPLWTRVTTAQTSFVTRLEKHILYLEDLLQRERVLEAKKLVKEMKRTQNDLKELLQQYKESGDPAARDALLDEIRNMQQQLQELAARLAELQREIPDEYLNQEGLQSQEMMKEAESLDEMIEEGRLEDAAKALEKMLEQTQKMVDDLDKTGEQLGGEENQELREKMERFSEELSALEAAQKEQLEATERAMEQAQKKMEEKLKAQVQRAVAEAKKKAQKAKAELAKVGRESLSQNEEEDVDAAAARTNDVDKALNSSDLEDAIRAAEEAEAAARTAEQNISDRQRGRMAFSSKSLEKSGKALREAAQALAEARKIMEQAMPNPSSSMDAAQREQMAKQGDRQAQLGEQAQKLSQLLDEIGKEAPIFGPEHKAQVNEAQQSMERAGRQLKGQQRGARDGMRGARQSQSQALQQLKALKDALSQMGEGGGGGGGIPLPLPGGGAPGSESENEGGSRGSAKEDVKIPDGSDFKVKDAFRKDILDAMREGAPDEWAGEVKRYYEELIR